MSTSDGVEALSRREILQDVLKALKQGAYKLASTERDTCLSALGELIKNAPGCSSTYRDYQGDYLLLAGAKDGCAQMVRQLLAAEIGPEFSLGETSPLYVAALRGYLDVVAVLVEAGASLEKGDDEGLTPLCCAAGCGHTEIVRFLAEAGADLNWETDAGWTPLSKAAVEGQLGSVKALVEAGAVINRPVQPAAPGKPRKKGMSALHAALESRREDLVEFLLSAGADPNLAHGRTGSGTTPLIIAAVGGVVGVVRMLVEAGADMEPVAAGISVLAAAAAEGHTGVVQYLVEKGASINHVDVDGVTALLLACEYGRLQTVKFLVEAGAATSMASANGCTPLAMAANSGSVESVEYLLRKGARDPKMNVSFLLDSLGFQESIILVQMFVYFACVHWCSVLLIWVKCGISCYHSLGIGTQKHASQSPIQFGINAMHRHLILLASQPQSYMLAHTWLSGLPVLK